MKFRWSIWAFVMLFLSEGCKPDREFQALVDDPLVKIEVPDHFPDFPETPDNLITEKKVELGRLLFHDARLSRDGTVSCASCHLQHLAFSDGLELSEGIEGRTGLRNAPTLANLAWHPRLFMDGGVPNLEVQILAPIQDENEMDHNILLVSEELSADAELQALSEEVFDRGIDPFTITRSIAAFERTIVSTNSKYDQFLQGEVQLTAQEEQGMNLFFSDELNCGSCHSGALFSDFSYTNIGLYKDYEDSGRERITLLEEDWGKFKVPPLQNVALTGPYMHDGSIATLEEVIDFFASGGLTHANKDPRMTAFDLSGDEKMALIAFLETLTDPSLLNNQNLSPPQ